MRKPSPKYDKSWKEIVTNLFEPFVQFFMPDLYPYVDWSVPALSLEQELNNQINLEKGKRIADKLMRVKLLNGEEKWVSIHIEFQTSSEENIGERMYEYYRLIYDKYGKEIIALVIYTGERIPKKYNHHVHSFFGTRIIYEFNTYAVIQQTELELIASENPFSIVVLANLYVLQTKNDDHKRYEFKKQVYQLAQNRGWSFEETTKILIFVEGLMLLEPELGKRFYAEISQSPQKNELDMLMRTNKGFRDLMDAYSKNLYGVTVSEMKLELKKIEKEAKQQAKQAEQAKQQAKKQAKQAEQAKQQAKKQAEQAEQAKQQAKKQAEQAKQQLQEQEQKIVQEQKSRQILEEKTILFIYKLGNSSLEVISELTGLPITTVQKVLLAHKLIKE
jgi:DNA repair exonuclease SbcCD ATPase subunit